MHYYMLEMLLLPALATAIHIWKVKENVEFDDRNIYNQQHSEQ